MKCKICSAPMLEFAVGKVLLKYDVQYYRCGFCGFIQTEDPYWLKEAYANPINQSDTGILERNIYLSRVTGNILKVLNFAPEAKFLDYGGGYGVLVRLMRDVGKDFYWDDPLCQNIFARGFEHRQGAQVQYELVTAFEVLEHSIDPVKDTEKMLSLGANVLFTTECIPASCPKPGEWDYYGLDHGQHISFFSRKALDILAQKTGMRLYSRYWIHLLTKKKLFDPAFKLACMISRYIS